MTVGVMIRRSLIREVLAQKKHRPPGRFLGFSQHLMPMWSAGEGSTAVPRHDPGPTARLDRVGLLTGAAATGLAESQTHVRLGSRSQTGGAGAGRPWVASAEVAVDRIGVSALPVPACGLLKHPGRQERWRLGEVRHPVPVPFSSVRVPVPDVFLDLRALDILLP